MEKDIEEIVQCYDRFVDIVKEISMNAKEQIIKLKGTIIADELASDFSEIGMMYAKELLENEWLRLETGQNFPTNWTERSRISGDQGTISVPFSSMSIMPGGRSRELWTATRIPFPMTWTAGDASQALALRTG